ncbi:MAG: hypothetical protein V4540_00135 [Pseudomonadota bacterium]
MSKRLISSSSFDLAPFDAHKVPGVVRHDDRAEACAHAPQS